MAVFDLLDLEFELGKAAAQSERDAARAEAESLKEQHRKRHDEITNLMAEVDDLRAEAATAAERQREACALTLTPPPRGWYEDSWEYAARKRKMEAQMGLVRAAPPRHRAASRARRADPYRTHARTHACSGGKVPSSVRMAG